MQPLDFFELRKAFPALIVQAPKVDDFVPLQGRADHSPRIMIVGIGVFAGSPEIHPQGE